MIMAWIKRFLGYHAEDPPHAAGARRNSQQTLESQNRVVERRMEMLRKTLDTNAHGHAVLNELVKEMQNKKAADNDIRQAADRR